jgi:hypothetical protein
MSQYLQQELFVYAHFPAWGLLMIWELSATGCRADPLTLELQALAAFRHIKNVSAAV